jgi:prepilin-type N-terminal cleavage/methylation domain-containing protein
MGFHSKKPFSGFTLIELMVVLAILATIASYVIPRFVNHRLDLKQSECKNYLEEIAAAEQVYFKKNGAYTHNFLQLQWTPKGNPRYLYGFKNAPESSPHTTGHKAVINHCSSPPCYSIEHMTKGVQGPLYGNLTPYDLPDNTYANQKGFRIGCVGNVTDDAQFHQATLDHLGHFEHVTQVSP